MKKVGKKGEEKAEKAKNVSGEEKRGEGTTNAHRGRSILILIAVVVVMVFAVIYWMTNSEKLGKRSDLVGDGICGNLGSEEAQNNCCSEAYTDQLVVACDGGWEYVSGIKQCQYICEGQLAVCPEDAKQCDDGSVRVRDAENECEFKEC